MLTWSGRSRAPLRIALVVGVPLLAFACSGKSKSDAPFGADDGGSGAGAIGGSAMTGAGRGGSSSAAAGRAGAGRSGVGGAAGTGGTAQSGAGMGGTSAGMSAGAAGGEGGTAGNAGRASGGRGGTGSGGDGATSSGATGGSSGEGGAVGGTAGTSGTGSSVGGLGPMSGLTCYGSLTCKTGDRCVDCNKGEIFEPLCTPDPDADPSGYQAAVASCLTVTTYSTCDGPEDCAQGEYCTYGSDPKTFGATCEPDPAPEPAICCFTCDAVPRCTLCWNDDDCPVGYLCIAHVGAPNNVGGCRVAD